MGTLEVIVGPMFAGKTEELIRRLGRAEIARQRVIAVKPAFDRRYDDERVVSHAGRAIPSAVAAVASDAYRAAVTHDAEVVGIEEVQFFDEGIVEAIEELVSQGRRLIVAGLDLDAHAVPFGVVPQLMALADRVDKLSAVCMRCGQDATRSQLLGTEVQGEGVYVELGGAERYEARCRECFRPSADDLHASTEASIHGDGRESTLYLPEGEQPRPPTGESPDTDPFVAAANRRALRERLDDAH